MVLVCDFWKANLQLGQTLHLEIISALEIVALLL